MVVVLNPTEPFTPNAKSLKKHTVQYQETKTELKMNANDAHTLYGDVK